MTHKRSFVIQTSISTASHPSMSSGLQRFADKPNCVLIDHQVKLNVALLPLSENFTWSFHYPSLLLIFLCCTQSQLFTPLFTEETECSIFNTKQCISNHVSISYKDTLILKLLGGWVKHHTYLFIQLSHWTIGAHLGQRLTNDTQNCSKNTALLSLAMSNGQLIQGRLLE